MAAPPSPPTSFAYASSTGDEHVRQRQQQQQQPGTAAGARQQQQQQQQPCPCIGWDLTLHPPALNTAYWHERALTHSQWDFQVVLFLTVTLAALTLRFLNQMGLARVAVSFGLSWLMLISWGVALYHPTFYVVHRIPIVLVGRVLMAVSAYLATNGVQEQLYKTLLFQSAALSLILKMFLFCNTGQMPVESVRLQLPVLWQLVGTGGKAVLLFLSDFTTEFAIFCNTPRYLTALQSLNSTWASLVQSGAPIPLPVSHILTGRSGHAVMAVTTLWMTDVVLIVYMCYISVWADMRVWLSSKARQVAAQPGNAGQPSVCVNGVVLTRDQLFSMCHTPFALLLNARSFAGALARVLLHVGMMNVMCMAAWVLSHVLVQQFLPHVLSATVLNSYYRELPEGCANGASSGVCSD